MMAFVSAAGFSFSRPTCQHCPRPASHSVVIEDARDGDGWYPLCNYEVPTEIERLRELPNAHIEFDTYEPIPYLLTETAYEILKGLD